MEILALVLSVLSLLLAGLVFLRNEAKWKEARERSVRVVAWHDGMGIDVYADGEEVEHLIAVRVFNLGDRSEHVMGTGIVSPNGDPIADDRPKAPKIVDEPPPEARELSPRGQIATQFKVSAEAIAEGFIGYATLGTGERLYSSAATPEQGLAGIDAMVRGTVAEAISQSSGDESAAPPGSA